MAKSKKETSSETPIVVNWVNENASKLSEVRSMNPTLYSAITMALDYLNKSLGGLGTVVMPEAQPTETIIPEAPTAKNIDPRTTDLKIKINSEAESRAFQEWAFSLGIEWYGGGSNLDNLTFPYLYIENKILDWGQDDKTFNNFNELEVTLADLGIVLPLETINPLTTDIKIKVKDEAEARAFQEWAFNNGVKWYSASTSAKTSNLNYLASKYFIIENGFLMYDSGGTYFRDSPEKLVTLKDLGITVPKTIVAVKKKPTPKVKATPTPPTPDVQNLYNELDDLDI